MNAERFWATIWLFVLPVLLTALSVSFLPQTPVIQLLIVPLWTLYWILTRPLRQSLWPTIWAAILCECAWQVPAGACVTFFLLLWWGVRYFRDILPIHPSPYHGLLYGVALLPLLHLWLWIYAFLWPTLPDAMPLMPSLVNLILLPAVGALGGSAVFAVAHHTEFRIFIPSPQDLREDEC
jgi:hypothetical protein